MKIRPIYKSKLNAYTIPSSFLSMKVAWILLVVVFCIGVLGFVVLENYSWTDALYMAVITISTVGFTEVEVLSAKGRIFTSVLIIFNMGIVAYSLAAFSYYIVQGEMFKKMHLSLIRSQVKKLKNHVIICGYGRYGKEITSHFMQQGTPFVIIEADHDKIDEIRHDERRLLYVEGDATRDEILDDAGIGGASAIISALPDDSENVFIVITARSMNPSINIISRAKAHNTQKKLIRAGANHVITPEQIGGFYMAALVSKPGAVQFFSFITNEYESDIGFEEINYDDVPNSYKDKSVNEMRLRSRTGTNIIGYKSPEGKYLVNPSPDTKLTPGAAFIVLGNHEQLDRLRAYLASYEE